MKQARTGWSIPRVWLVLLALVAANYAIQALR
jgi:hypothetical protein